jgi:glycosyltransferase involved in cell wall biosynthesis
LEDVFFFHGFIDQDEIPSKLAFFDMAIFPSEYEGFGVAAAECMAFGLPVLYNSINSTLFEVVGNAGWAVSIDDMPEFLMHLDYADYQLRVKYCISRRELFKVEEIADRYINVYSMLT